MDDLTRKNLHDLYSEDREVQHAAFIYLIEETEKPVDWAYDVWDELVSDLSHKNNRVWGIASQVLCNLAKSDPEKKRLNDFSTLLAVTKDERLVSARQFLQSIWKVGVVGDEQRRYDIIEGFRNLFDVEGKHCN